MIIDDLQTKAIETAGLETDHRWPSPAAASTKRPPTGWSS